MWCADCQQDVPAVVRSASEPLLCSRCQRELAGATSYAPSDSGVALESYDQPSEDPLAPPIDWREQEASQQRLREIDWKLSAWRSQAPVPPIAQPPVAPPMRLPEVDLQSVTQHVAAEPTAGQRRNQTSWLLSLLLSLGVATFGLGLGLLAWSVALGLPQLWQPGMTLTIGAEGLLILSLAWMAARLWRNGRRVNRQLHGVDQQLAKIEQLTGTLAGSANASSQHFYHHFSQGASPHLLVANLQGQVDQFAARMASQR